MGQSTPWVVGLTGGIGSGKTAAARYFSELGVHVVDADQAARWVVEPGQPALAEIVRRFGSEILQPDGTLNRAALRQRIFQEAEQRRWLESVLHPRIQVTIDEHLAQAQSPYAILVSPLLIESGQYRQTQRVLVVDVPESVQIARTVARDQVDEAQVQAILKAQLSRTERLRQAHDVLLNEHSPEHLAQEVKRLHEFYLGLTGGQP